MNKKIYVVYPQEVGKTNEAIMEYVKNDGDVNSFTDLVLAEIFMKRHGGWINEEIADEEVWEDVNADGMPLYLTKHERSAEYQGIKGFLRRLWLKIRAPRMSPQSMEKIQCKGCNNERFWWDYCHCCAIKAKDN